MIVLQKDDTILVADAGGGTTVKLALTSTNAIDGIADALIMAFDRT